MSKKYYELTTNEEAVAEINKMIENVTELWILWQIYRCTCMLLK